MPLTVDVIAIHTEKLGDVYIPRLSLFMADAIKRQAADLYPLPDPKPYELPIPDAVIAGDTLPAVQNPEYQKLITQVMLQRNRFFQYAILKMVRIPDCTHDEIVAVYKDTVDALRQYAQIPDGNDLAVTLHYCVLTPPEYMEIINAASKDQPLREEEIRDNLRIFRRDIQRDAANGHHRAESTPDIQEAEQVQA